MKTIDIKDLKETSKLWCDKGIRKFSPSNVYYISPDIILDNLYYIDMDIPIDAYRHSLPGNDRNVQQVPG